MKIRPDLNKYWLSKQKQEKVAFGDLFRIPEWSQIDANRPKNPQISEKYVFFGDPFVAQFWRS